MELYKYYRNSNFNPTAFKIESEQMYKLHKLKRDNLYINKLGLPNIIWKNRRVLEVGCSSGENAVILAKYGAKFHFIEPLQSSIERLLELFKHFKVEESIEKIDVTSLECAKLNSTYDIIIAEGFIFTLEKRKEAIRKLFSLLSSGGLLIFSTVDPVGIFLEYFKAAIANLYAQSRGLVDINEKIDSIRPFFESDYNKISHSREFGSWAKDNLFSPLFLEFTSFCYGFEEIVGDLRDLFPVFYSSWPDYKNPFDFRWHKNVQNHDEMLNDVLVSYGLKQVFFVLGESFAQSNTDLYYKSAEDGKSIGWNIETIKSSLYQSIKAKKKLDFVVQKLSQFKKRVNYNLSKTVDEMIYVIKNLNPKSYLECENLRKFWGIPYHYIVFRKITD